MSDYTPTTDDIQRLVYEYGSSSTVKITWEDFNAWLASVKAEAWAEGYRTTWTDMDARYWWPQPRNPYSDLGKSWNDFQAKVGIEETE